MKNKTILTLGLAFIGFASAQAAEPESDSFKKYGQEFKGTGELWVNGKKVAEGAIDKTTPGTFSLSETFDVGVDNGTPVSNNYKTKDHFPFTGEIDKVVINLIPDAAK